MLINEEFFDAAGEQLVIVSNYAVGMDNIDLDAARMPGHRFVHGVIQHLGKEVMHRLLVSASDIHAGTPAHGLQAFQHLDVGSGIGVVSPGAAAALRAFPRGRFDRGSGGFLRRVVEKITR